MSPFSNISTVSGSFLTQLLLRLYNGPPDNHFVSGLPNLHLDGGWTDCNQAQHPNFVCVRVRMRVRSGLIFN